MCRHLCPVQLVTGKETNTPRAKGLQVSMMERGMEMDVGCGQTMYECLLCGACTNDCVTGFDPLVFIREARTRAVLDDLAPAWAKTVIDRLEETGNPYGAREARVNLSGVKASGDTLLWLGSAARYAVPDVAEALMAVLRKAGVDDAVLPDEPASGAMLGDMIGYVEDVRAQARQAAKAIKASGARRMIVLDSQDAAFFLHECKDWGVELPPVVTATAFVAGLIQEGRLAPRKVDETVSYHDAMRLARDLDEHAPAREMLTAMGAEVVEMFQHKRLAKAAGSSLMGQMQPELSAKIAAGRFSDLMRTGAKILVAADPQATEALRRAVPEGYEYRDLFVMLNERL